MEVILLIVLIVMVHFHDDSAAENVRSLQKQIHESLVELNKIITEKETEK